LERNLNEKKKLKDKLVELENDEERFNKLNFINDYFRWINDKYYLVHENEKK